MNPKIIIIAIAAVILLVAGAFFGGLLPLGIINDDQCITQHIWNPEEEDCNWVGNSREYYEELILYPQNTIELVTAWQTGADSVPTTVLGEVTQVKPCTGGWNAEDGWYKVEMNTGSGWNRILETGDGSNSYTDSSIIGGFVGSPNVQKYADEPVGGIIWPQWGGDFIHRSLNPIVFEIKGPRVGALRVTQMTNFWEPWHTTPTPRASSIDHIYLVSGKGDLSLVDPKTRYIAGEDTIQFRADVGASGQTQGDPYTSLGWTLTLEDSNGETAFQWIDIPDNTNKVYSYPIPSDVVKEGESHTWKAILNNALFDQDEVKTFVITKAELLQCPDIKQIFFDKSKYMLGDTVTLNMEGIPNVAEGNGIIDGFEVTISYGGGTDWVGEYHDYYTSANNNNKASVSFNPIRGDINLVAKVWAFDGTPTSGGLMSDKSYAEVYVQDEVPQQDDMWILIAGVVIGVILCIVGLMAPTNLYVKMVLVIIGILVLLITVMYYFGYI